MALNCKFKIGKNQGLGKITDITKEFRITKNVKHINSNVPNGGGKKTSSSSGKTWKARHY